MSPAHPYASKPPRKRSGFTLIELMVGMALGLVATLAITQVLVASQSQKQSSLEAADAQVSGILAIDSLRRSIQMAGYGFSSVKRAIGCTLRARYKGTELPDFPANLVPVLITDGAAETPDTIRILHSSKVSFSVPLNVVVPGYVAADPQLKNAFPVTSAMGVAPGDLLVAYQGADSCQVFQASAVEPQQVQRQTDGLWNVDGFPNAVFPAGTYLFNMGTFEDIRYSVGPSGTLRFNRLELAADSKPSYSGNVSLYSHVVNLQALYGKASAVDGIHVLTAPIDRWDTSTPNSPERWQQVLAVRVAIVSRSEQYEKDAVTTSDPQWDLGTDAAIPGAYACGGSQCLTLKIPRTTGSSDWQHYRYKVFDSLIPLRNMLWSQ